MRNKTIYWLLLTLLVICYLITKVLYLTGTYGASKVVSQIRLMHKNIGNLFLFNLAQPSSREQYLTYIKSPIENNFKKDVVSLETFRNANTSGGPLMLYPEMQRLGNNMYEFASAYCTALQSNHTPTIGVNSPLLHMFNIQYVHILKGGSIKHIQPIENTTQIGQKLCCYEQPDILAKSRVIKGVVLLLGIMASFKYLLPCESIIRTQFTLQNWLQVKVRDAMASALLDHVTTTGKTLTPEERQVLLRGELPARYTYVGVHIRRTDRPSVYPSIDYVDKAIKYYQNKYTNPVFYMCSDDIKWCIKSLLHRYNNADLIFMSNRTDSHITDFGVLMSCNHSAITAGTFGFWTAWLAGGDVVYHTKFDLWQTALHPKRYQSEDFYPPEWIRID